MIRPPLHFWLGAGALLTSHVLVLLHVEPLYTYFFSFAWWPYILWIDGWVYWRTGTSLLLTQPRAFVAAAFWSIACWCLYEAFNFRLQNWYYVMTPAPVWAYHLNYAVGFATVFPGLCATAALLSSFGVFQHWRTPPFVVTPRLLRLLLLSGLLATMLPLVWPLLFFPLIWLSMALLFEPLVYRWQGQSLLAELSRGDPRRLATLLVAGAINGGLWEGWNVLTRTGWIYTVPLLDWFHVFEMPLAGYLGFPLLAIECAVLWSALDCCHLTGAALPVTTPTRTGSSHKRRQIAVVLALGWSLLVFAGINRWTSSSQHLTVAALPGLTVTEIAACEAAGFRYPYAVVQAVTQRGLAQVATELRLSSPRVQELVDASQLSEFRGIGPRNLRLLHAAGVSRIEELAAQDSATLTARLHHIGDTLALRAPYERQVRGWIAAARRWTARQR
ncbi:MAG: DUF4332 domain-containing protein [Deltaproteobacteria bacterium]|nr:DUF4332 domain-containing protein [Deltaproteobacteria bacterium]